MTIAHIGVCRHNGKEPENCYIVYWSYIIIGYFLGIYAQANY